MIDLQTLPNGDHILEEGEQRFQKKVHDFILRVKPKVVVETGIGVDGISSAWILLALDKIGQGHLCSIESINAQPFQHPRWTFIKAESVEGLPIAGIQFGVWDIFLHDSDHEVWCETYEYEFGHSMLRQEGYLLSDDCMWGTPPHLAWIKTIRRHHMSHECEHLKACGVEAWHEETRFWNLGGCGAVKKTEPCLVAHPRAKVIENFQKGAIIAANVAEAEYRNALLCSALSP